MKVGLVGWRSMVGSVPIQRMQGGRDLDLIDTVLFSTSNVGGKTPALAKADAPLVDVNDIETPKAYDTTITCQDGDYVTEASPKLCTAGWNDYWIDAALTLHTEDDATITLDPVNLSFIKSMVAADTENPIGGNCTNSILLMSVGDLFREGLVGWINPMTYQAASGGGVDHTHELFKGMDVIHDTVADELINPASVTLNIDRKAVGTIHEDVPTEFFPAPLVGGLVLWIDKQLDNDQLKEERKGQAEVGKALGTAQTAPVDDPCVRIGAMRYHSLGLTLKFKRDLPLDEIEQIIRSGNSWMKWAPNDRSTIERELTLASITGDLGTGVGCMHKLNTGPEHVSALVIGDQLPWDVVELLRRTLRISLDR